MSDTPTPPPPPQQTPLSDIRAMPPAPPVTMEGHTGPLGRQRSIGLVILLSIVTFGIWTIVWSYQNGKELKAHAGTGLGGPAYLIITLLVAPVTMFLMPGEIEAIYRRKGQQSPVSVLWGLWFLLPLIGNIIWYVRVQRAINDHWASLGAVGQSI